MRKSFLRSNDQFLARCGAFARQGISPFGAPALLPCFFKCHPSKPQGLVKGSTAYVY